MVIINDRKFYDKPGSCGSCPFFFSGSTYLCPNKGRGICTLFNEMHQPYINPQNDARNYLIKHSVCLMGATL